MNKKQTIRIIYTLIILALFANSGLFAQVNQAELENLEPVEFINYEGPYSRIETRAQIRDIGYGLGLVIRNGQTRAGETGRYFVIHSVTEGENDKLDADIFGLGVDVGVDHIRNLRLIIQGYLEGAYNYSERDAALLAEYITIYNAVYRGDMAYFSSRYKDAVMENIVRERAGLSIRFDEWPGQTLMLIPLGLSSAGPLSAVSTVTLADPQVTDQLREDDGMGLDSRRDMVDLMERQADEAAQTAEAQREAITQQQEQIQQQQQQVEQQQQQVQQQQQQVQQEQQAIAQERQQPDADQTALDQRQQQVEEQQQQVQQQQEQIEQQQQQLAEQQQQLEQQQQTAEQVEQYAQQVTEAAQQQRTEIAQDQQAMISNESQSTPAVSGILGASINAQGTSVGRVVIVNPSNSQELRRSALNTVNTRSLVQVNDRLIAIAGEARGSGAVRLVEIDQNTLEIAKQGDDDMSPDSLVWVNGNDLYAIASSDGNFYLARFNIDLVQQARSTVTVHQFASIIISGNYIITQRADGSAVVLNLRDLTQL